MFKLKILEKACIAGMIALASAKCLEAVNALWSTNGQAVNVCPYRVLHENFDCKSFQ